MKFYHATQKEKMKKIIGEQKIRQSCDGVVYLCKQAVDSCKFLAVRGAREMSVIEIELNENDVEESFDHSESFFKCKAYMHYGDIELSGGENIYTYEVDI